MATEDLPDQQILHASAVAYEGRAALILGPSGAGKSSLALELMAYGCTLVADDAVALKREGARLMASAPAAIAGRIEARGIGLLKAGFEPRAEVALIVDLGQEEVERLPRFRTAICQGITLPCVHKSAQGSFPAGVLQYLKAGRAD